VAGLTVEEIQLYEDYQNGIKGQIIWDSLVDGGEPEEEEEEEGEADEEAKENEDGEAEGAEGE